MLNILKHLGVIKKKRNNSNYKRTYLNTIIDIWHVTSYVFISFTFLFLNLLQFTCILKINLKDVKKITSVL